MTWSFGFTFAPCGTEIERKFKFFQMTALTITEEGFSGLGTLLRKLLSAVDFLDNEQLFVGKNFLASVRIRTQLVWKNLRSNKLFYLQIMYEVQDFLNSVTLYLQVGFDDISVCLVIHFHVMSLCSPGVFWNIFDSLSDSIILL